MLTNSLLVFSVNRKEPVQSRRKNLQNGNWQVSYCTLNSNNVSVYTHNWYAFACCMPLILRLLMEFCFCPSTNCTQQSHCIPGFEANTFENYTSWAYCFRLYDFLYLIEWIGQMITFSLIMRFKTIPSTKMHDTRHIHSSCFHMA